jgi:hypothetical protein
MKARNFAVLPIAIAAIATTSAASPAAAQSVE